MNNQSTRKATAVRRGTVLVSLLPLLAGPLAAQVAPAPSPTATAAASGEAKVLEAFEVTGSRVKRVDYETPAPVITFTAANIEDKGYHTLGEFVQSLPYNSSTANSEFTTASFITGAATVNPRGLGSNRVLTLINGRRGVPYALTNSASGTAQTVFNFNSIPPSAIDRLEFLKDGASALYGSDAITGVYNIILKKNYEGSAIDMTVSNTTGHDTLSKRINLFTGLSRDGWEVTASLNYNSRNDNYLRDFGVTSTDYRSLGVKGLNQTSTITHPSYLNINAAQAQAMGLGTAAGIYVVSPQGVANPQRSSFRQVTAFPVENRFDLLDYVQIYPKSEGYGGHTYISKALTPEITAFAQFLGSRSNIEYKLTPYGFTNTLIGLSIPATNPYNPTGVAIANTAAQPTLWSYRGRVSPIREVKTNTVSAVGGIKGTWQKKWNWETAVNYGQSEAIRTTDYIAAADLQRILEGTTRATAWNPFGPSDDPEIERKLFTRSKGLDNKLNTFGFDASVNASVMRLPWADAGELGLAAGYEFRRDDLSADPEPRNFLGFTATQAFSADREVNSIYAELSAPVKRWLELQAAARHEIYSDFGSTTKPKFAGKVRLPSNRFVNTILRASFSQSFKAPDLGQLYQPRSFATTSAAYLDPLRPQDGARQLRSLLGGEPNLKPELGKVQYVGAVFEVPAVRGLSFSIDFFDQKIRNQINTLGPTFLLSAEGQRDYPNGIVRETNENPGRISYILGIPTNRGLQLYRGIDYGARYTLRNTRFGSFTVTGDATQIIKRGSDAGQGAGFFDNTGLYFDVEWRYNYGLSWRHKHYGASVVADIIGKFWNDRQSTATFAGWGENVHTVVSPSFSYRGFKRTTITLSALNVFDVRPPVNGHLLLGFDDRAYGASVLGRVLSVRVRREF